MSLEVVEREEIRRGEKRKYLQIRGSITLPDGRIKRVRLAPQSQNKRQAREEAAALQTQLIREGWHGPQKGIRSFADAVKSYIETSDRNINDIRRLQRIDAAFGKNSIALKDISQTTLNNLKSLLKKGASGSTATREIIVPVRAVMRHAEDMGWCTVPRFKSPKAAPGRTNFFNPQEIQALLMAAAPHIKPLLIFLVGTGARMSEAINLDWRDVDLADSRVHLWDTKSGKAAGRSKPRHVELPLVVVEALSALPHRAGRVFLTDDGKQYAHHNQGGGGHIKTAWKGAIRRAGLSSDLTPHCLRHTWATWHYAQHKDLLRLKVDGGWSTVTLVERYAHLMGASHVSAIEAFLAGEL